MQFVVPDIVTQHFHLCAGDTVADFGAGRGFFLNPLTKTVGDTGTVFLLEIQKELVELMSQQIRQADINNAKPIWCDLEEAGGVPLPPDSLDVAICVNTLFQIADRTTFIQEIKRTLRHGGKLYVIDWTESSAGLGPTPDHLIDRKNCIDLFETEAFVLEQEFPAGAHHYGLAFRNL